MKKFIWRGSSKMKYIPYKYNIYLCFLSCAWGSKQVIRLKSGVNIHFLTHNIRKIAESLKRRISIRSHSQNVVTGLIF